MIPIWFIQADMGYFESETWIVCSYTSREQAQNHCDKLNELAEKFNSLLRFKDKDERKACLKLLKELDPILEDSRTKLTYEVVKSKLFRHIDEYIDDPQCR